MTNLAISDATSDAGSAPRSQNKNLTPFKPGQSGNPAGVAGHGKRHQELYSGFKAELGGELDTIEDALLDKAVTLLLRRPRSDADAVKLTSEARRILSGLRAARAKAKLAFTPLRERLVAEAAEAEAIV